MHRFLLFALLALALGAAVSTRAADPIQVGVSLGLTARNALPSQMHKYAYELCQAEVNGTGGVLGRPIAFDIRDDRGSKDQVARIYDAFTAVGGVDVIFAPYGSDLTLVAAGIAEARGFPMLAPGAAADGLWGRGYRNLFGVITPASRYSLGILELASEAGVRRLALLHAVDDFSREIAEGTRKWGPFLNLKPVFDMELDRDAGSDHQLVAKIRAAGADMVVVAGYFDEAVRVRRALSATGWMPRIFFATVGPSLPAWITELGTIGDLAFTTSIWEPPRRDKEGKSSAFASAFKKRFGIDASYQAAAAYAACEIMVLALRNAGSLDRDLYRKALFAIDHETLIGRFICDSTGMQTKRVDLVVQWINGRKEIVWPKERQTMAPKVGEAVP